MKFKVGDIVKFKGPNGTTTRIIGINNSFRDNIALKGFNFNVPDNMLELVKKKGINMQNKEIK